MRRSAVIIILAALFIVWLAVVAYLAMAGTPPAPAQTAAAPVTSTRQPVDTGLGAANGLGPGHFALETVNPMALAYPLTALNGSAEKEIYTIVGKDVDASGAATTWIYGIRHAGGASFLIFDENGWHTIPASDTFPGTMIDPGSLVNVSGLFLDHPDLFAAQGITDRQIEISENRIRVTVREGTATPRISIFDATTGALI